MSGKIPSELGTKNISSLLKQYAVPAIIAMTAASLYNIIDSIFIGHIAGVGAYALSGMSVTFPLMNLSTALGTLVGVGGSTMVSILLGQKKYKEANTVLGNEITLNSFTGLLFTFGILIWLDPVLYFFGAGEHTLPFAREYMKILLYGNIVTHLYFGLNNLIRASGSPKLSMNMTIFTVVCNTILDPLFIFTFDMGIKGAAWATVISQFLALSWSFYYFSSDKSLLKLPKHVFNLNGKIAKKMLTIGLGPFLMHSTTCLISLIINQRLRKYGSELYLGAYGIINKVSFLFMMICIGLNQGMQPIAGFNYGARKYSRVKKVFYKTTLWATIATTAGCIISVFYSNEVVTLFTNSEALSEISSRALRLTNPIFFLVGFHIVTTNFFQCLGMVKKSIFLSLTRQLIFLLPALYLLPKEFGTDGIWLSFPVSDIAATIISTILLIIVFKKMNKLKDGDDPGILGSQI